MTGRTCCVQSCRRRSHDHRGRKIPNGLTFHCFPAWRRGEGEPVSALTYRRRKAWVSAVNRSDISFNHIPTSMRVCSRHFISGKPAYEVLESDPDWLPSLYLGQSKSSGKQGKLRPLTLQEEKERKIERKKKKKERREAAAVETNCSDSAAHTDVRRPVVPPWKHVKPLLQAVLQKKPDTSLQQQQPAEETQPQQQPAEETQQSSFRDFFSKALDAALDESSRSRTRSSRRVLPQNEEDTCADPSSSSSCLKCVSLQRRVEELEESLLQNPNHLAPIEKETPECKPAYEVLESDPDWLPSLYLSSGKQGKLRPLTLQEEKERKIERKKKKKERREAAAVETNCSDSAAHTDVRRPVVLPWKHVKPLLQAMSLQPTEEMQQSSFRDFFSKALDAALDESSRSRTRSSRQFLPQNEEDTCADSSSSSSCLKCVSLQRRVEELEESLLQNPNHLAPIEKETPEWMQPISSPDIEHNSDDEDSLPHVSLDSPPHVSLDSPPHVSLDSPPHVSLDSPPRRKVHRFNTAWLTRFPFLRYCPVQDMMWCHVCRLYADKTHHYLALIRGSRMFKAYNIRIHSNCNFHRKNTKLYKSRNLLL